MKKYKLAGIISLCLVLIISGFLAVEISADELDLEDDQELEDLKDEI